MKLSFDGYGINGGDEYMSRIATFTEHGRKLNLGHQFAAAPELLQLCEQLLEKLPCGNESLQLKAQGIIARAKKTRIGDEPPQSCPHLTGYWIDRHRGSFRCYTCGFQYRLADLTDPNNPERKIEVWQAK